MLRLIYHYFGMDSCKSCETLRAQLEIANHEKSQLLDRLLKLSEPEVVHAPITFAPPKPKARTWDMQRKTLEEQDVVASKTLKSIEQLEKELEIKSSEDKENAS